MIITTSNIALFEPYHGYPASFFLPLLVLPSLRSAEIKDASDMLDPIVEYTSTKSIIYKLEKL